MDFHYRIGADDGSGVYGMTIRIRIEVVGKEDSYHAQSSGENLKQAIANLIDLQNWESMEKTLKHFGYSEKEIAEDKARGFHYVS